MGTINVQHSCRDHGCPVSRTRTVYQEREKTTELSLEVTHKPHDDYIINTSQMRNSSLVQPLRVSSPRLDRSQIIHRAVAIEVDAAKARQQAVLTGPLPLQPDPIPNHTSSLEESHLHRPSNTSQSTDASGSGSSSFTAPIYPSQLQPAAPHPPTAHFTYLPQPSQHQLYVPSRPSPLSNHMISENGSYSAQPPSFYPSNCLPMQPQGYERSYHNRPPMQSSQPSIGYYSQRLEGGSRMRDLGDDESHYFTTHPSQSQ